MKKRTKKICVISGIIAAILVVAMIVLVIIDETYGLFVHVETYPEEVEMNKVIQTSYKEIYSEKWKFGSVEIYDEEHDSRFDARSDERIIELYFCLKEGLFDDGVLQNISEIYKAVAPAIRECLDSSYASYPLVFYFTGSEEPSGDADGCIRIVCMDNCKTIKMVVVDGDRMSLKAVAGIFPELNQIEYPARGSLQYDSIEDIAGFDDLQVVDFGVLLPEEDKEYILSLYPDCEIVEESYYKYKE